jgi:hypothetical protein
MAKFHERAIAIFGVLQKGENIPVIITGVQSHGTISVTGTAVTGTGTYFKNSKEGVQNAGQLTPGAYLYQGDGSMVGQIASVTSDTAATLVEPLATAITGKNYSVGLGPRNCLAVLNLNFSSSEISSEAFQYAGSHLDRAETTVITDWTAKVDFETFLPVLGEVTGVPTDNDIIAKEWFETCGFKATTSNKQVQFSNIENTDAYMTLEIRRSSEDMAVNHKVYTLTNARGTIDFDMVIGTKPRLKWNFFGNYGGVADKKKVIADTTKLQKQKETITGTVSAANITNCALRLRGAKAYELSVPTATAPAAEDIITFGGLTITFASTLYLLSRVSLYPVLAKITPKMTAAEVKKLFDLEATLASGDGEARTDTVSVSGTFGNWDIVQKSVLANTPAANYADGGLVLTPIYPNKGSTAPAFTWKPKTGPNKTVNSQEVVVNIDADSNVVFDKLAAPNLTGFEYNRFRVSTYDSWSKGASPSDVTFTILEDQKTGAYVPEQELENEHELKIAYMTGNSKTALTFNRLQLTNITNSTIASYAARDLTFRNTASASESLGTLLTLSYT